ncbi:DUF4091 domain-containing protein [Paenibacillus sp. J5C_2022]|uniref:DUF4091 domain-containing protein n=1 Tax=Paenibacillus sp. J5C2022 TaxID=2977129 RepID=UPI0021CF95B0|nr:DUF4091 domain-containing protein [Paenibacillus sp. J5C2022]MCU6712637.1 DUF4091 domain-containing protein [Paenibacillus sp. J5C2022]
MSQQTQSFETRCLSSLSKVFPQAELHDTPFQTGTALWNEVYSFQVAYRSDRLIKGITVELESELAPYATIRAVGLSPAEMPAYAETDSNYITTEPGLFPDVLYPVIESEGVRALPNSWRAVWVTVKLPTMEAGLAGKSKTASAYPIKLTFKEPAGEVLGQEEFRLDIVPAELPEQKLIHTEWFHSDCIASRYGVDIFSEAHWALLEQYVRNAADHGVNLLLTPLFTPPLDTAIGGERPTVQLVGVEKTGDGEYRFSFEKLDRWIGMCRSAGIRYFEMSHLFTQWGAKHAPKIVATVNGSEQRIFGWETDAAGEEYAGFLNQFLPQLVTFIKDRGLQDAVYFHVSDEPHIDHLEQYKRASELLRRHLDGFKFIDALSDYSFYEHGLVEIPVPSNDHIDPFLEGNTNPLWTYYCCGQFREVSNRFFSMPSARNRVLGLQLYKFDVEGFLHWGYNFWYSQYSTRVIDPFCVTDAVCAFPSGDAFVVYPGDDGPIDSLRWEVFREAQQDQRALELLESLAGRDKALELIEQGLTEPLHFKRYPSDMAWLLGVRERINAAIAEALTASASQ